MGDEEEGGDWVDENKRLLGGGNVVDLLERWWGDVWDVVHGCGVGVGKRWGGGVCILAAVVVDLCSLLG